MVSVKFSIHYSLFDEILNIFLQVTNRSPETSRPFFSDVFFLFPQVGYITSLEGIYFEFGKRWGRLQDTKTTLGQGSEAPQAFYEN